MRIVYFSAVCAIIAGAATAEGHNDPRGQGTNTSWGQLTAGAIEGGFDQGAHSSDPSGDGKGKGNGVDEPRVGLANVVEQGNMGATTDLIESLLP